MIKTNILATIAALNFACLAPAFAQTVTAQVPATSGSQKGGPNEIVCEKQEVIGSRLAMQRICKTRAQWEQDRHEDRSEIERVQTQRGCTKNGC